MIIKDINYIYQIPEPDKLVNSLLATAQPVLISKINTNNILDKMNEESKIFFIENPEIFKLFMKKITDENKIPPNFYMYTDAILNLIKQNGIEDSVDDYWKNMKGGQKQQKKRKRRKSRKSRKTKKSKKNNKR